jgi:hypothetical protein
MDPQHGVSHINLKTSFFKIFLECARDEQLLRGREGGYILVTLHAALHYLNSSNNFETDIFGQKSNSAKVGKGDNGIDNDLASHSEGN